MSPDHWVHRYRRGAPPRGTTPGDHGSDATRVSPSVIEGMGLFARRPFAAGERIRRVNVVREITADAPLREDLGERFEHCDHPDGRMVLVGFPDRYLNHSCDPNAYLEYTEEATFIRARRDIAADEEITCDYNVNVSGGTSWPCSCGAPRCGGTVVGDYFLLPSGIRAEYRPLLAAWFVRRHRERLEVLPPPSDDRR